MKADNAEVTEEPAEIIRDDTLEDAAVDVEDTESSCPIVPGPDKQEGLGEGIAWWALPHPLDPAPCMKSTQPSMVTLRPGQLWSNQWWRTGRTR